MSVEIDITAKADKVKKAFGEIKSEASKTFGAIKAAGAAALAGIGSATAGALILDDLASKMRVLDAAAKRTGVSVKFLSSMSGAAEAVGSSQEKIIAGMQQLGVNATKNEAVFKKWGIASRDANGNVLTTEQLLKNVSQKMEETTSSAQKLTIANELLGGAGADLVNILDQNNGSIDELQKKYGDAQTALDDFQKNSLLQVAASFGLTKSAMGDLTRELGAVAGPVFAGFSESIAAIVDKMTIWIKSNRDWLASGIDKALTFLGQSVLPGLAAAFDLVAVGINTNVMMIRLLANGITGALATAVLTFSEMIEGMLVMASKIPGVGGWVNEALVSVRGVSKSMSTQIQQDIADTHAALSSNDRILQTTQKMGDAALDVFNSGAQRASQIVYEISKEKAQQTADSTSQIDQAAIIAGLKRKEDAIKIEEQKRVESEKRKQRYFEDLAKQEQTNIAKRLKDEQDLRKKHVDEQYNEMVNLNKSADDAAKAMMGTAGLGDHMMEINGLTQQQVQHFYDLAQAARASQDAATQLKMELLALDNPEAMQEAINQVRTLDRESDQMLGRMSDMLMGGVSDAFAAIGESAANGFSDIGQMLGQVLAGLLKQLGMFLIQLGTAAVVAGTLGTIVPPLSPITGGPMGVAAGAAAIVVGTGLVAAGAMLGKSSKGGEPAHAQSGLVVPDTGHDLDSYPALLRRGERVLTPEQNARYERGGGGGSGTVIIQASMPLSTSPPSSAEVQRHFEHSVIPALRRSNERKANVGFARKIRV